MACSAAFIGIISPEGKLTVGHGENPEAGGGTQEVRKLMAQN
jgi:hypothetical protein